MVCITHSDPPKSAIICSNTMLTPIVKTTKLANRVYDNVDVLVNSLAALMIIGAFLDNLVVGWIEIDFQHSV